MGATVVVKSEQTATLFWLGPVERNALGLGQALELAFGQVTAEDSWLAAWVYAGPTSVMVSALHYGEHHPACLEFSFVPAAMVDRENGYYP